MIAACLGVARPSWADESKEMKHVEDVMRERVLLMERVMLHSLGFYLTVDHIEDVLWSVYEVLIKRKDVEAESLKDLLFVSKTIVRLMFRVGFSVIRLLSIACLMSFHYPFRQLTPWLLHFASNSSH